MLATMKMYSNLLFAIRSLGNHEFVVHSCRMQKHIPCSLQRSTRISSGWSHQKRSSTNPGYNSSISSTGLE